MHSYIATEVKCCTKEFGELAAGVGAKGDVDLSSQLGEESDRFRIWAGNIGAFQQLPNKASLDWRLRDGPKISTQIMELLGDIREALRDSESKFLPYDGYPKASNLTTSSNLYCLGRS